MAFLHRAGVYRFARRPDLVVLDLNMPKVGGCLQNTKEDEKLGDSDGGAQHITAARVSSKSPAFGPARLFH